MGIKKFWIKRLLKNSKSNCTWFRKSDRLENDDSSGKYDESSENYDGDGTEFGEEGWPAVEEEQQQEGWQSSRWDVRSQDRWPEDEWKQQDAEEQQEEDCTPTQELSTDSTGQITGSEGETPATSTSTNSIYGDWDWEGHAPTPEPPRVLYPYPRYLKELSKSDQWVIYQRLYSEIESCCHEFVMRHAEHLDLDEDEKDSSCKRLWEWCMFISHKKESFPKGAFDWAHFGPLEDLKEVELLMGHNGCLAGLRHMVVHRASREIKMPYIEAAMRLPAFLRDALRADRFENLFKALEKAVEAGNTDVLREQVVADFVAQPRVFSTAMSLLKKFMRCVEESCFEFSRRRRDFPQEGVFTDFDSGWWCDDRWYWRSVRVDPPDEVFGDEKGCLLGNTIDRFRGCRNCAAHGIGRVTKGDRPNESSGWDFAFTAIKLVLLLGDARQAVEMELAFQQWYRQIPREEAIEYLRRELLQNHHIELTESVDVWERWTTVSTLREDLLETQGMYNDEQDQKEVLRGQWVILDVLLTGKESLWTPLRPPFPPKKSSR